MIILIWFVCLHERLNNQESEMKASRTKCQQSPFHFLSLHSGVKKFLQWFCDFFPPISHLSPNID